MIRNQDTQGESQVCVSCNMLNTIASEYCTSCGAPLGMITEITQVGGADHPRANPIWRVYGVETGVFGREADFEALMDTLRRSIEDNSCHLFTLSGPQGIGKTRLLAQFNEKLEHHFDGAHLVAGASRGPGGPPYAALSRLIKSRFYIHEQEQGASARQKLLDGVRATMRNPLADEIAHMVGYLIGLPYPESTVYARYGNSPAKIVERARDALLGLLQRDALRQPLVLVLEDLHLAGDETLDLIRFLHTSLSTAPVLIVCIVQPELEERAPWLFEEGERKSHVPLMPLDDVDIHALVKDILKRAESIPEELLQLICERSFGNPMSVEGSIRVLIDEGVIDTRGNSWTIHTQRIEDVELPNTFEGLIRARLSGLTDEERLVLEKAALVGPHFWPKAIQTLHRLDRPRLQHDEGLWPGQDDEDRIVEVLRVLHRKDMIRRRRQDSVLPGHREYAFKHEIERQIVYDSIDPELRKRYHLITGQWLEAAVSQASLRERFLESIALHYELGGSLNKSSELYIEAGRHAATQFRNQTAVGNFEKALAFLGENNLNLHIAVLHDVGTVLDLMGEPERSLDFYGELLQSAWLMGNRSKVAVAYNKLGRARRTLGNYESAMENLNRGLSLFEEAQDKPGIALSLTDIGMIHNYRGDYAEVEECFTKALSLQREIEDPRSEALTLNRLGTVKLGSGMFKEALRLFRQSLELRRKTGDRRGVAESLNNLAVLCQERGEMTQSLALFEEAVVIAREIGDRTLEGILLNNIGEVLMEQDGMQEALVALDKAAELSREIGARRVLFDAMRNLARLHQRLDRRELALKLATKAHELSLELAAPVLIAIAMRTKGELLAGTLNTNVPNPDEVVRAEESFRQSIKLLTDIGNESELGRSQWAYGDFLLKQGLTIQGRKRLELAKEIFARLEMKRVLSQTQEVIEKL